MKNFLLFFIIGTLGLTMPFLYNTLGPFINVKNDKTLKTVQISVKGLIDDALAHSKEVEKIIRDRKEIRFSALNTAASYPYVILKGGALIYWSQHTQLPETNLLEGNYTLKTAKSDQGKVLLVKTKLEIGNVRYEIVHIIWLTYRYSIRNDFLKSGVNKIFSKRNVSKVNLFKGDNNLTYNNQFLCSVEFADSREQFSVAEMIGICICLFFSLSFFSLALVSLIKYLIDRFDVLVAWISLISILGIGLFGIYKLTNTTLLFSLLQWFDYEWIFYFYLTFSFLAIFYIPFRYGFITKGQHIPKIWKWILDAFLWVINAMALYTLFSLAKYWFQNAYYTFNIFYISENTSEKVLTLILLVFVTLGYFLVSHLVARNVLKRRIESGHWPFTVGIASHLALGIVFYFYIEPNILPFILSFLHVAISVIQGWPATLKRPRYVTYLYLFSAIVVSSVIIAEAAYLGNKEILAAKALDWSRKINKEVGSIDYKKLKSISDSLKKDNFLKEGLQGSLFNLDDVEQKIRKYYIADAFEQYECNIYLFDFQGVCINRNIKGSYFYYLNNYSKSKFRTQYSGIFRVTSNVTNHYSFIQIFDHGNRLGYVVLEFKLRRLVPNSIIPALFRDEDYKVETQSMKPSYAIYKYGQLVSESGAYSYSKELELQIMANKENYNVGVFRNGYYQQLFDYQDDKSILISLKAPSVQVFTSNFSFIFSILSAMWAIFIFSNTFYYKLKQVSTTFTTKIQLFINIAFFMPLLVVCLATFSLMTDSYKNELEDRFIQKAEFAGQNLSNVFLKYNQKKSGADVLLHEIEIASKYVQSDIVLYDLKGKLLASTQPSVFEMSLLAPYINPEAFSQIIERKEPKILTDESIGLFKYKTVYFPILSLDNADVLGIISIPFFESDLAYKEKVMESLTTILNIFTIIFIIFLVITYFFSYQLTQPLALLTNKIKYTSLEKNNEPLPYSANDEIGLLVKEYNQMLKKLEENKKALALNEKESAWREMAKQVAHEIKNPLTPMKLALQNMQRMLKSDRNDKQEIALKSADVLLEQIENLNEIAGSFSAFAQMPLPKKEVFDMVKLIQHAVFLFQSESGSSIKFLNSADVCQVSGDENMMSRILINLLRNAIEAVPEDRNPDIEIQLAHFGANIQINVSDNGMGISEDLEKKIFQPNFSTKTSGSGIGLALAKRGLEQMGGKISFQSQVGKGTTFTINFPIT